MEYPFHMVFQIDEKDRRILEVLLENSDLSIQKISKRTGIPITTVHNRIKRLKKNGVILNYTVKLNYHKLGKSILAFILINVDQKSMVAANMDQYEVLNFCKKYNEVEEANLITGRTDILLKARFENLEQLTEFVVRELRSDKTHVSNSQTLVVLRSI